jgi:hypothetical protein
VSNLPSKAASGYSITDEKRYDPPQASTDYAGVAVPFQVVTEGGILSFLSTTTVFGTPVDITLLELALESFFPANAATADALRQVVSK